MYPFPAFRNLKRNLPFSNFRQGLFFLQLALLNEFLLFSLYLLIKLLSSTFLRPLFYEFPLNSLLKN